MLSALLWLWLGVGIGSVLGFLIFWTARQDTDPELGQVTIWPLLRRASRSGARRLILLTGNEAAIPSQRAHSQTAARRVRRVVGCRGRSSTGACSLMQGDCGATATMDPAALAPCSHPMYDLPACSWICHNHIAGVAWSSRQPADSPAPIDQNLPLGTNTVVDNAGSPHKMDSPDAMRTQANLTSRHTTILANQAGITEPLLTFTLIGRFISSKRTVSRSFSSISMMVATMPSNGPPAIFTCWPRW